MKNLRMLLVGVAVIFSLLLRASAPPEEGMWLPMFVERLNYVDMQKMGLRLTAEEIYSINHSSLKDAIVGLSDAGQPGLFDCTGEIVSDQGLLFTNHHCAYDYIQQHTAIEHDYLRDGFWAMSKEEELPNEGLTATFFIRMEDVTDSIIPFLSDTMSPADRSSKVREISSRLKKNADPEKKYWVSVSSFFEGNEYYLFVYQIYRDVRLVGAPPSSIGNFGGDTDNFVWPRHTGDFSIFRVYTAPDGSPADYSEDNIPLNPGYHLRITLDGVKKDDFAMIWGYPGATDRYLSSFGVEYQMQHFDPTITRLLSEKLSVWKEDMDADREVAIKYAYKYRYTSNGWKLYLGQEQGLRKLDVKSRKEKQEEQFQAWIELDTARKARYGQVLEALRAGYDNLGIQVKPLMLMALGASSPEILNFAQSFGGITSLLESKDKTVALEEAVTALKQEAEKHFKDYNGPTDQKLFARMMEIFSTEMPLEMQPEGFREMVTKYNGDFQAYASDVFEKSILSSHEKVNAFLDKPSYKVISRDPAISLSNDLMGTMMEVSGEYRAINADITRNERLFIAGLREMIPGKAFYPDANSTMRMTYGSVQDYKGADAVFYDYKTHLSGVMQKEDPSNEEFIVPERLKQLFEAKEFGRYGSGDDLVVCFLTTNDCTGGNSGSPVINGNGEMIGLVFDGNWESLSGDIAFEPNLQRAICVDIRYVLFIIDKFAGATNLIDELTIVP